MKAIIKATEDVVEVSLSHIVYDNGKKIIWYNTPQGTSFTEDELEFIDTGESLDYWTRLEHQAAIVAMQAQMAPNCLDSPEGVACTAYAYAHALVEKLKEKEERK